MACGGSRSRDIIAREGLRARPTSMRRNHRRDDLAGIAFLLALLGSAFVPSVLSEARRLLPPAAVRLRFVAPPAEPARLSEGASSAPRALLDIELPSETSAGPADDSVLLAAGARLSERLCPSPSLLPRAAGPPRRHEPRAPPPPPFAAFRA